MTLRPCLDCGQPTAGPRCTEHMIQLDPAARGYDTAWRKLSLRARKLQPFCSDCGTTTDLQTDHLPQAWARKAVAKAVRLCDVEVVCGPCNRARGAARPGSSRSQAQGGHPGPGQTPTPCEAKFASYTPWGYL